MQRQIPFFVAPTQPLKNLGKQFDSILTSGILIKGKYNRMFEDKLKEYLDVKHIVLTSSGTIGLAYLFKLINPNQIFMPSFTFGATATTASWAGLKNIKFLDIDKKKWNLSVEDLENQNIKKNSLVVPVNMFGNPNDFDTLEKLSNSKKFNIVYDAAHSLGSTYKNKKVASQGSAQVFSLSPTKVLTSAEGGVIATNDEGLANELKSLVEWGHKGDYNTILPGLNARMSEVHALIGYESLKIIDELLEKRFNQVELYKKYLNSDKFIFQEIEENSISTYKDFPIIFKQISNRLSRKKLIDYLQKNGVSVKTYFDPPIHKHHYYKNYKISFLKNTEEISKKIICLPLFYTMTRNDIKYITKILNAY